MLPEGHHLPTSQGPASRPGVRHNTTSTHKHMHITHHTLPGCVSHNSTSPSHTSTSADAITHNMSKRKQQSTHTPFRTHRSAAVQVPPTALHTPSPPITVCLDCPPRAGTHTHSSVTVQLGPSDALRFSAAVWERLLGLCDAHHTGCIHLAAFIELIEVCAGGGGDWMCVGVFSCRVAGAWCEALAVEAAAGRVDCHCIHVYHTPTQNPHTPI